MSIDLDNVIAIDVLAHLARERDTLELVELVATPDGGSLCAHSIEGQFMHELVVPYMLRQPRVPNITRQDRPHAHEQQTQRLFAPGDPWLYAKAYTGSSLINRVFLQYVLPIVASAKAAGHCDQWFFVRFADPHPHLRIRLRAQDPAQRQVLQERLCQALRAAIDDGVMYRFQLDSYDREIERYGGPQAISAVELLFCHDSECAVDLLNTVPTADEDERWTLAMASIDHWLSDLNLSLPARCALLDHMHSNLAREFRSPISLEYELGQRYRLLKPRLEAIMNDAAITLDARDAAIRDALSSRSTRTANPVRALQEMATAGSLSVSLTDIAASLIHMCANRLLQSATRAQEMVMYSLMSRCYRGQIARNAQSPRRRSKVEEAHA